MKKYQISSAAYANVPVWLQNLIWYMWEAMSVPKKSCLQIFRLSRVAKEQRIEHIQRNPYYYTTVKMPPIYKIVCGTVFLVEEENSISMLFTDEYLENE